MKAPLLLCALFCASESLGCINGYHLPALDRKIPRDAGSHPFAVRTPRALPPEQEKAATFAAPKVAITMSQSNSLDSSHVIERPHAVVFELPPPLSRGLTAEQRAVYTSRVAAYRSGVASERTPETRADYAMAQIYLGEYEIAIKELKSVEPVLKDYIVASALGTAYELAGNLSQARKWIAVGLKRSLDGHDGTEWLHLAIIDTKLALRRSPGFLQHKSVLDHAEAQSDDEIVKAIEYQLNERLSFVGERDPIVADLFYQAAVRTPSTVKRTIYLRESLRYGDERKAAIDRLQRS